MRNTTLALFMAVGASILLSSSTDAAPISRSSSQTKHQQDEETLIVGRIQIKSRSRHPASSPSASASSSSSSSSSHKHKHKHNKKKSITHHASKFDKFLISDPELSGSTWYPAQHRNGARALVPEGHAVIDDEDDDAGNELLDTELESGLERPDDDDTIEGEVLEEEDLDEFDAIALDYGDDEGVEGHLLQHTLRAANTAANVARAKAAAMAAAARARAVESLDWLKESEDAEAEEEEVVKVVLSRFGGRAAAADMAAQAGEV
ncbi:hypothetical protein BKA57DRAFT_464237 [Linnemannia elongata]|nr:hypothetical protein BGZ88_005685 [Linnemannia elongata]KAG0072374.1 hypothetical protein BGZ89_006648 [Linnemannia elongata]KAH7048142.1 hypothetical protein BKA57DRAFT_464237 [Linnemannia elongata]